MASNLAQVAAGGVLLGGYTLLSRRLTSKSSSVAEKEELKTNSKKGEGGGKNWNNNSSFGGSSSVSLASMSNSVADNTESDFTASLINEKDTEVVFENAITTVTRSALQNSSLVFDLTCTIPPPLNNNTNYSKLKALQVTASTASVILGATNTASEGGTSVICTTDSFNSLLSSLNDLKNTKKPLVFHVACRGVDTHTLEVFNDYSALAHLVNARYVVLLPATPQEIQDFALVAHFVSFMLKTPVATCFDGLSSFDQYSLNHFTKTTQINKLPTHGKASFGNTSSQIIRTIFSNVFPTKLYAALEYHGSQHAKNVVVVFGAASYAFLDALNTSKLEVGDEVGVLVVKMLFPLVKDDLVNALPQNLKRVCVVDFSEDKNARNLLLFNKILVLLHGIFEARLPTLLSVQINAKGGVQVTPTIARFVFGNLLSPRPELTLKLDDTSNTKFGEKLRYLDIYEQASCSGRMEVDFAELAIIEKQPLLAQHMLQIANEVVVPVQVTKCNDPYNKICKTEIRFAQQTVSEFPPYRMENISLQLTSELIPEVVFATRPGGKIILFDVDRSSQELERMVENLSDEIKTFIVRNEIEVYQLSPGLFNGNYSEVLLSLYALSAMFSLIETQSFGDNGLSIEKLSKTLNDLIQQALVVNEKAVPIKSGELLQHIHERALFNSASSSPNLSRTSFTPRLLSHTLESRIQSINRQNQGNISWNILFKRAFHSSKVLRPGDEGVDTAIVTKFERLTPMDYERNIFHVEFDITNSHIKYEIGDALGVFGENNAEKVDSFIKRYRLNRNDLVKLEAHGVMRESTCEYVSVINLLLKKLDIFGKVSKKFYCELAKYAKDKSRYAYLKLMHTGTDDTEQFKLNQYETITYAELLLEYAENFGVFVPLKTLVTLIPMIKARHYSIASSMKLNPTSVHLLVVSVDWVTPLGKQGEGQCTRFLKHLKVGQRVVVDIQKSVLKLPDNPKTPIVMAGLGTGMAPFRAFIQHRYWQHMSGISVGPMVLYFGARHKAQEWLYGSELEKYEKEGLLKLGLAWSRDQKEKVYIQHVIKQDAALMKDLLASSNSQKGRPPGWFFLCGPTWPVPDVRDALAYGLQRNSEERKSETEELDVGAVEEMKNEGRYILEVY